MLVNFALFGRSFLEFAMMYPAEYLCLASLQEHLRAPRKTYAIGASVITLMSLAGAAVCSMLDIETNFLLIPLLIISFWLLRWRTDREVSISQTMFLFSVSAVMMSVCTLLAVVLNAEAELDNALPVFLPSTSVICLTLSVILSTIFRFTAVRWNQWLLQEYHGEAFWGSAWPLPALYAAFLVFCIEGNRYRPDEPHPHHCSAGGEHLTAGHLSAAVRDVPRGKGIHSQFSAGS